jgi:hypothetical protein
MTETTIAYDPDEVALTGEISDEMLEAMLTVGYENSGSYTLAVCTGLSDCPGP